MNLDKQIIYQTNVSLSPKEIEGNVPPSAIFACYSAYSKKYQEEPADYDKVFLYADLKEAKKRFPFKKGYVNLTVLKKDPYLSSFKGITPDFQTFVDLWNLKDWYAKEFLNALKDKIL